MMFYMYRTHLKSYIIPTGSMNLHQITGEQKVKDFLGSIYFTHIQYVEIYP